MKKLVIFLFVLSALEISAQDVIQWRGTDRTGIYKETGLLKSWPAGGPSMLWHFDGLGEGHSSVAIASGKVYITGLSDGKGYLYVFDLNGKLLNKKDYGTEWSVSYNGSRGTPTINNGKIYIYTGTGNLVCMNESTLDILWQKSIEKDFNASNIRWGVNESPLIIGDKVIITPGGKEHNVVALDKDNGNMVWSSPGEGDLSAYCSALYLSDQQIPLIITMTARHILGVNADTGEKIWSYPYNNNRNIHANTPVYDNNMVFCTFGYGKGSVMLRLTNGGRGVEKAWEHSGFDSKTGGAVKVGDYVYGSGDNNKYWYCLDWKTGKQAYQDNPIAVGAVIAADGMLYCYSDKGEMALVRATPEKFDMVSKFPVTLGTEQHWAHPAIYRGVLYLRHGNTLMAYKII